MADGNGVGVAVGFGVMPCAFHVIYTYLFFGTLSDHVCVPSDDRRRCVLRREHTVRKPTSPQSSGTPGDAVTGAGLSEHETSELRYLAAPPAAKSLAMTRLLCTLTHSEPYHIR